MRVMSGCVCKQGDKDNLYIMVQERYFHFLSSTSVILQLCQMVKSQITLSPTTSAHRQQQALLCHSELKDRQLHECQPKQPCPRLSKNVKFWIKFATFNTNNPAAAVWGSHITDDKDRFAEIGGHGCCFNDTSTSVNQKLSSIATQVCETIHNDCS